MAALTAKVHYLGLRSEYGHISKATLERVNVWVTSKVRESASSGSGVMSKVWESVQGQGLGLRCQLPSPASHKRT